MNRAARAAVGCLSGPRSRERAARTAGLRRYETEIRLRRGKCFAPGCASRHGVTRVSIDTRDVRRIDRLAVIECVQCGRPWRRVDDDTPVTRKGYQCVLITLIAPSNERRVVWMRNGASHAQGEDTLVVKDASLGQLQDAAAAWRRRNGTLLARLDRAKSKREERAAQDRARAQAILARLAESDAARRDAEAEADAREKAGLA